jgi:cellulose synthase/poly-beta-1,6-N-acetylglucosamine synthase-like glycosyltransferase
MIEFICLGVSFGIVFFLWKSRINYLLLGRLPVSQDPTPSDLTVVIPARNEAHQIANAIRSFPGVPVIVVDDASSDHTAAVSKAAGATVISAPPLPPNSLGKPNACAAGAALAKTKWLLFVDADTSFHPRFAASAVHHAEHNNYDLLSAFLEQKCVTLFEKMLLPYSFALYFTGVSARAVNRTGNSSALANGQCLLFRRASYEQIGGHAEVIGSVIEDVALAQLARRNNLPVRVLRAEHLGSVRMYASLPAIWRGFQKNSFRFLQANPAGGIQVILASILLTSWLPALILGLSDYPSPISLHLLLMPTPVLLLFIAPFLTLLPWYAEARAGRLWRVILAPAAIYFFQLIALNGMLVTLFHRTTDWKGRRV